MQSPTRRGPPHCAIAAAGGSRRVAVMDDDAGRVAAQLLRGFTEITGIRAEPAHAQTHRWRHAKTHVSLGESHLLDARQGLGICGDGCLGHRVEHACLSGLALALATL